jgi:DNA mismatch repair protein MutS
MISDKDCMEKVTPLMQQYRRIKKEFDDTLVFFQVGDFYELFFEDAKRASSFLGITLTKRGKEKGEPIPLCGVPVHALEHYLTKLIKGGFKVAIADQLSEAKPGTIVERGVTRVLTPGTLTDSALLDEKSGSYLCAFFPLADRWGVIFGELLTGQLFATEVSNGTDKALESELVRFFPDEIVIPKEQTSSQYIALFRKLGHPVTSIEWEQELLDNGSLRRWMHKQFSAEIRRHVEERQSMYRALGIFYAYMTRYQQQAVDQFKTIQLYDPDDFLILDGATQRNLELVRNSRDGSTKHTLFSVIDTACTGMGSRMIKKWILRPLRNVHAIEQRQEVVQLLLENVSLMHTSKQVLKLIGDVERIIGRIALNRATLQDYKGLLLALSGVPELLTLLVPYKVNELLALIVSYLHGFDALTQLLTRAINPDISQSWYIAKGFNAELDRMREYAQQGNAKLLAYEKQEQELTGITSLKVRYNKVQGYYIEITKANNHLIPDRYIRHQSLVGKERFVTTELQALQHEINQAIQQVDQKEKELFEQVKHQIYQYITSLRKLAYALAHIDALWGFAHTAYTYQYICPEFVSTRDITIEQGRHPVVEAYLENTFIPNDTNLTDEQSLWIITGPNMGGKSTYLRQVALISVLAHTGSFVSARKASLPLLDRIFTRIGAGDNLAEGKSTFLVEMEETALICTQATEHSLIILDEVGRGTSTFDGLAIAQAVIEYLYMQVKARCLFATHYHELYHVSEQYLGIVQYHAASHKSAQGIVFLHTILPGVSDGSFGIEVAKLAQLPASVVQRAQELVSRYDKKEVVPQRQLPLLDTLYE